MGFIRDLLQDSRIRSASDSATDAATSTELAHLQLAQLERRLARLTVISEALWNLLKMRHGCADEELLAEIARVELAGETQSDLLLCPGCGRPLPRAGLRCVYCGGEAKPTSPFDGL